MKAMTDLYSSNPSELLAIFFLRDLNPSFIISVI